MANFKRGSRYTNGVFTLNADDKEFLILRESLEIPETEQDIYLTVEGRFLQRIDLISQEVYGRADLGWVIMDINKIRQPLLDLVSGQVLRVPPLDAVLEAIQSMNEEL
jgi:hypothetical protein